MANTFFRFKQFSVQHAHSAMKVGTDGVLLGAWCDVGERDQGSLTSTPSNERATDSFSLLDIGCGTGLIALMMAQRCEAGEPIPQAEYNATLGHGMPSELLLGLSSGISLEPAGKLSEASQRNWQIDALEPDRGACLDAAYNFVQSPWASRLSLHRFSLQDYLLCPSRSYARIVSNPPYFIDSLRSADRRRDQARHARSLTSEVLLEGVSQLLEPQGLFSVILPFDQKERFIACAASYALHLTRQLEVHPNSCCGPKRVLMEFAFEMVADPQCQSLVIESQGRHHYSAAYEALTRLFYLKF